MTADREKANLSTDRPVDGPPSEDKAAYVSPAVAFLAAIGFLTRIPLPRGVTSRGRETLHASVAYFPLAGALIGSVTAALAAGFYLFWPAWLAVVLALTAEARLTGAFHEDAVADFFDAFGGGWNRDDIRRILKDSRIGSYGVVALVLSLFLRAGSMAILVQRFGHERWYIWAAVLVAGGAIGRLVIVIVMSLSPPAPDRESLSRDIGSRATASQVLLAALFTLPAAGAFAVLQPASFAIAMLMLVLAIGYFVWYVKRRLGGMTGDCLGCICYISQVIVLLAAVADTGW